MNERVLAYRFRDSFPARNGSRTPTPLSIHRHCRSADTVDPQTLSTYTGPGPQRGLSLRFLGFES
jgi:hypothetical protein